MTTCAICKKEIKNEYEENNPYPICGGVCCPQCNDDYVIPVRIGMACGLTREASMEECGLKIEEE